MDGIPDASYNPVTRLFSFVKATQEIPVAVDIDDTALDGALERVKNELSFAPKDGMLELNNGQLKVTKPVLGQTVEPDDLKNSITENWLDPAGVEVEPVEVEPAINDDAIEAMRTGDVAKALDNPLTINGENNVAGTLRKDEIAQFVSIEAKDGKLELKVDTPKAQQLFEERMDGAQVPGQNAKISFSGDKMNVTPSVDGSIIDWEKTLKDFDKRVKGDERTWDADYKPDPAEYTTEMAEKATFNDTVSEFSTGGFSGASGENIRRVAAQVDGAVVNPGETFSSTATPARAARRRATWSPASSSMDTPALRSAAASRSSPPRSTMPLTSPASRMWPTRRTLTTSPATRPAARLPCTRVPSTCSSRTPRTPRSALRPTLAAARSPFASRA